MTAQAIKKERKFEELPPNLKAICIKAAEEGNESVMVDPLAVILLIDHARKLSNDLDAVKNELRTIELLSATEK